MEAKFLQPCKTTITRRPGTNASRPHIAAKCSRQSSRTIPPQQCNAIRSHPTVDTLLKPENKGTLTKVLTYHVVSGRIIISS